MTEHCYRMTIEPADVAKAVELFAADHEDADDDWAEEVEEEGDDDEIEKMNEDEESEADEENNDDENDDAFIYDASDSEEYDEDCVYIDEDKYSQNNTHTPMFDKAYPPVEGDIVHLTDVQFREEILAPLIIDVTRSDLPLAEGVDGMIKRALYGFVVATLCADHE